jgi:hypothetical protein
VRLVLLAAVLAAVAATPAAGGSGGFASALPPRLPASTEQTFYVAPTGSDDNPGSRARPWRTVQHAIDRLRAGQRVLVAAGTYTEAARLARSGTASAPITIAAQPGQRPVLQPPAASGGNTYALEITGAYWRVRGFVLQGARGTSSADVYVEDSANHIELSGNEIRGAQDQGVFADPGTSDVQIIGNRIHDNGAGHVSGQHQSHGLYLEGARDLVANNVIYNQPYGFGIQIYPRNRDSIVVGNTVVRNGLSGIVLGGDEGVSGIVVRNNIFAYNNQWGIAHDSANPHSSIADHNLTFGNRWGAIEDGFGGTDFSGGNLNGDPRFAGRLDFRLRPGSRALGRALRAWSLPYDVRGHRRPTSPAAGAYDR